MKQLYFILAILITAVSFAQTPQGFNYQATVRDNSGELVINQNVYFKFNVIQGSQTSVPIYTETHYVSTDDLGQVGLVIGQGTAETGSFSQIDWSLGNYFLGIELDTGSGNNYVAMGTTQMLSVPYALYAESSGNATTVTPNLQTILAEDNSANNQQIKNLADPTDDQDAVTKAYTYSKAEVDDRTYTKAEVDAMLVPLQAELYDYPEGTVFCDGVVTKVVDVTNPTTGKTWMDRNLGASQVATSSTDAAAYGDLYQWGRGADSHQCRDSETTSTLSSIDQPGHGDFITINSGNYDWRSPQNDNLWQGVDGVNNPCPSGYRLPTDAELEAGRQSWSSNDAAGAFASPLILPMAGFRSYSNGSLFDVGTTGFYWSSTVSSTNSRGLFFNSGGAYMYTNFRAYGLSVRCLKSQAPSQEPETPDPEVKIGVITEDETWTNDRFYVLNRKVVVPDSVTLTIEPGTIIKGEAGSGSDASALIIARGGKLMAEGTAEEPIIFTTINDNIEIGQTAGTNLDPTLSTNQGFWGGLIVLGKATCSFPGDVDELNIEGIFADDEFGRYGGTVDDDNSGVLKYISIRHGGALIGQGNEINGLTLGGVGNGTVIENIEVVANLDDGIEWFGGTVDSKNLFVWACGDDSFDVDQAYSGTIDNVMAVLGNNSDHAFEIDGPEGSYEDSFVLKNATIVGNKNTSGGEYADFRSNAQAKVSNVYAYGFKADSDVELDNNQVAQNFLDGDLTFENWEIVGDDNSIFVEKVDSDAGESQIILSPSFTDRAADWTSEVTKGDRTVGADTSVFAWTYSNEKASLGF